MTKVTYEESERISATLPRNLYKQLVHEASENMRSVSAQIAYALKERYEGRLAKRVHHNQGGKREIQD